ncbi:SET domain-containing protein, partial [Cylindrobasidium torrendii FP15055 ss-10]
MRRGFLLGERKGKPAVTKAPAATTTPTTTLPLHSIPAEPSPAGTTAPLKMHTDYSLPFMKLQAGVIENAGRPEGYYAEKFTIHEDDPDTIIVPDDELMYTSIPPGAPDAVECIVSGWVKRDVLNRRGFPKPLEKPVEPAYRIEEVPGKGLGMVAARKFSAGDLICDERPLSLVPTHFPIGFRFPKDFTAMQIQQALLYERGVIIETLVDRMPKERKEKYMNLANCHLHDGSNAVTGIMRTNAFGLEEMQDNGKSSANGASLYQAVWDHQSRINHSCCPNASRTWDLASFSQRIRAARDIEEGEEITTQYTCLTWPYEKRKEDLLPYEIDCKCPSCIQMDHTRSDKRRKLFEKPPTIHTPKTMPKDGEPMDGWIAPALKVLRLMEDEGLQLAPSYKSVLNQL